MSYLLSSYARQQLQQWFEQEHWDNTRWQAFLEEKSGDLLTLTGRLYAVDHEAQQLVIKDLGTDKEIRRHDLKKGFAANAPENPVFSRWADTAFQIQSDGALGEHHDLTAQDPGLLIQEESTYLYPQRAVQNQRGTTHEVLSPFVSGSDYDAYDLVCTEDRQHLLVVHRWVGKVSVFNLPDGKLSGMFKVRGKGSRRTINIDPRKVGQRVYMTDNQTAQLHVLDLEKRELESFFLDYGTLGNMRLSPDQSHLYVETLEKTPGLLYLDRQDLSVVKSLKLKGDSLCIYDQRPLDHMVYTPDRSHLLFVTFLNEPCRFTPVVNVIETERVRTVRRYAIKTGGRPYAYLLEDPYPVAYDHDHILEDFVKQYPQFVIPQAGVPLSSVTAPPIQLPDSAEAVLVDMAVDIAQEQQSEALEVSERQELREQAVVARQELEVKPDTQLTGLPQHTPRKLKRNQLFQAMKESPKHQGPLYQPREICALCGAKMIKEQCISCGGPAPTPRVDDQKRFAPERLEQKLSQAQTVALLRKVSFLKEAELSLLQRLERELVPYRLRAGEQLIEEKTLASCLYFVVEGQLEVYREQDKVVIATLTEGDVVGEMALVSSSLRSASVRTREPSRLLRLERAAFLNVIQRYPVFSRELKRLAYRRQATSEKFKTHLQMEQIQQAKARLVMAHLKKQEPLSHAPRRFFEELTQCVQSVLLTSGRQLFAQGDAATSLFFIERGEVEVEINGRSRAILNEGTLVGEMSFFLHQNRSATVKARSLSRFLELSYRDFENVLKHYPDVQEKLSQLAAGRLGNNDKAWAKDQALPPLPPLVTLTGALPKNAGLYFVHPNHAEVLGLQINQWVRARHEVGTAKLFEARRMQDTQATKLVADTGNHRILRWQPETGLSTLALPEDLQLNLPMSACLQDQTVVIADTGNQRIVHAQWGDTPQHIREYTTEIIAPVHVSMTPEGHILYADKATHQVIEMTLDEEIVWEYGEAMWAGREAHQLATPHFALRLDKGLTLIADTHNHRVIWVNQAGEIVQEATGTSEHPLEQPYHCEATVDGNWWVWTLTGKLFCLNAEGTTLWAGQL